jgi:hypothetical protein
MTAYRGHLRLQSITAIALPPRSVSLDESSSPMEETSSTSSGNTVKASHFQSLSIELDGMMIEIEGNIKALRALLAAQIRAEKLESGSARLLLPISIF